MSAKDARKAFGKVSPDLNLITKVKEGGGKWAAYVAALLKGSNDRPEKSSVFPNIAMPSPFSNADPDLARKARDVSAFLDYFSRGDSPDDCMPLDGFCLW